MRIFVTGTGRCGTSTFAAACRHITNYTSAHESMAGRPPLDYPDNHIEVDPHLSHFMAMLINKYPDSKWVHLVRDRESCVKSLARRPSLRHWANFTMQDNSKLPPKDLAGVYYDSVTMRINTVLTGCVPMKQRWHVRLERLAATTKAWDEFWRWIGAEGDFEASKAEWQVKYNATG